MATTAFMGADPDYFIGHSPQHGDPGHDVIVGGKGSDRYDYGQWYPEGSGGVRVNLASGEMTSPFGSDELRSVEEIIGTEEADVLIGDKKANLIAGEWDYISPDGADVIRGGGGPDDLRGILYDGIFSTKRLSTPPGSRYLESN